MIKVLFVCLGNICRSPAAENLMNDLICRSGLDAQITCDSAGTAGYHIGSPPDQRMVAAAAHRGLVFTGHARQLEPVDLREFDLILAMDRQNYQSILHLDPDRQYHHKIKMMCEFCRNHNDREVPDPYYGGAEGFDYVIDLLIDGCAGLLQYIRTNYELDL